jgi:hypothetical protein
MSTHVDKNGDVLVVGDLVRLDENVIGSWCSYKVTKLLRSGYLHLCDVDVDNEDYQTIMPQIRVEKIKTISLLDTDLT